MSYDITGWQWNEGSGGNDDWLTQASNYGSEVANYVPGIYNGSNEEAFNYEPGIYNTGNENVNNANESRELTISSGGNNSGGYTVGSQWGSQSNDKASQGVSLLGGSGYRSGGGGSSGPSMISGGGAGLGNWFNEVVTTAMKATKAMPTYNAPTWNKDRVKALTQRNLGNTANQLGNKVSEAITRSMSMDNPMLQKEYMRGTLRGYGEGMGTAQDKARNEATAEYSQEYASDLDKAKTTYDAALKDYFATMEQTTTRTKEPASIAEGAGTIPRSAVPSVAILRKDSDGNTWWGNFRVVD